MTIVGNVDSVQSMAERQSWKSFYYRNVSDVVGDLQSGKGIFWNTILMRKPVILRDFLYWFADHLTGSPPASMVLSAELSRPQDFLNGHAVQELYRSSAKVLHHKGREGDPMAYILERAGIPVEASDIFAANRLGRLIPWDMDIPGPTLLAFLQEIKTKEEADSRKAMPPLSLWGRKEFRRKYNAFQGKSLLGLLEYFEKVGEKEGRGPIPLLREKLRLIPTVDDVIDAVVLGEQITSDMFTSEIVGGLLIRAADERKIDTSEITVGHLRETSYHFLGDRPLHLLVNYAKRNKPPSITVMQFLQIMAQDEIRRRRSAERARAKEMLEAASSAAKKVFPEAKDRENARDAAGDGLLYMVERSSKNPETIRSLPALTHVATKSRAFNLFRHTEKEESVEDLSNLSSPRQQNPADIVVAKDETERIRQAIKRLPARWRAIVEGILAGFSYEEISAELNISEGAIGPTLNRAAEKIRNEIGIKE